MEGYRERAANLWDDAPWSELGLPAAPVVAAEEIPHVEIEESTQDLPRTMESSAQTRSSSWD